MGCCIDVFNLVVAQLLIILLIHADMYFFSFVYSAIVPFANPKSIGAVYGLVGAGGSIGSIVFNYIFKVYGNNYIDAFRVIGYTALLAALLTLLLKIESRMLLGLIFKKLNP